MLSFLIAQPPSIHYIPRDLQIIDTWYWLRRSDPEGLVVDAKMIIKDVRWLFPSMECFSEAGASDFIAGSRAPRLAETCRIKRAIKHVKPINSGRYV